MSLVPAPSLVRPDRTGSAPLERCGKEDLFHDYVLGRYAPTAPHEGKLRSVSLLYASFAQMGVLGEGTALVNHLRGLLGPFRTVWGIKQANGRGITGWELYFYDWERAHTDVGITRLRDALSPVLSVDAIEPHPLPWHMWSIEITPDHLRREASAAIDVYIDMRSYKVRESTYAFENVYTFHDPHTEIDAVLHRLRSSVHFDEKRDNTGALIPPSLFRCGRLCVANKRAADALYFSRVPSSAAGTFVRDNGYPPEITGFFSAHRAELDHLLWDVGLDFRGDDGPLRITKTSIYGSL